MGLDQQCKRSLGLCAFYLGGDQPLVAWPERLRSVLGAFIGLMLAFTTAKCLGELSGVDECLMASLGASALLVFALPGSPMAQRPGLLLPEIPSQRLLELAVFI